MASAFYWSYCQMAAEFEFTKQLEAKVAEQIAAQRVAYLLGAGSSYMENKGYPLAFQLWDRIKDRIPDPQKRDDIQLKLNDGATGIEHALDLLDDGGALDTPYRHMVTAAIADLFRSQNPSLDLHVEFVRRLSQRADPYVKVFSLNYDPLMERAAEAIKIRLSDGFVGMEHAYFDPAVFEEWTGQIRGTHRTRQLQLTVRPIHLLKLHGSLGWYESTLGEARRTAYSSSPPNGTKALMIPPQRRKATDTMLPPYAALWSAFRGCLGHRAPPINRLVCLGYGFADEHVNAVIEPALARADFTLLIFTKALTDAAWNRWSQRANAILVTESRSSLKGTLGPGHPDLWRFERLCKEV